MEEKDDKLTVSTFWVLYTHTYIHTYAYTHTYVMCEYI
jgi:hypothetical protein